MHHVNRLFINLIVNLVFQNPEGLLDETNKKKQYLRQQI